MTKIRKVRKVPRKSPHAWLAKKSKHGFQGYPLATIAFYGPMAERASKVAVSIFLEKGDEPDELQRWFSEDGDVRNDTVIGEEIQLFLRHHQVRSVVMPEGIIGCPHEEGIDYPNGQSCPKCPYWKGRDRFTHERIQ